MMKSLCNPKVIFATSVSTLHKQTSQEILISAALECQIGFFPPSLSCLHRFTSGDERCPKTSTHPHPFLPRFEVAVAETHPADGLVLLSAA